MRSNRGLKMVAAATVGAVALSVTSLAGTAQADLADDVAIMVDNVPAAVQTLIDAGQTTVNTYLATNSFEQTNMAALGGVVQTANALAAGTEQFGSLGLGMALVVLSTHQLELPYLQALDDPSKVGDLVNPDDLSTLASQLAPAFQVLQPHAISALVEGLQGNITAGVGFNAGIGTPATVGNTFVGVRDALYALTAGTNYEALPLVWAAYVGVAGIATAGYAQQLEDGLAPVFEALAPVTSPIAEALTGL